MIKSILTTIIAISHYIPNGLYIYIVVKDGELFIVGVVPLRHVTRFSCPLDVGGLYGYTKNHGDFFMNITIYNYITSI